MEKIIFLAKKPRHRQMLTWRASAGSYSFFLNLGGFFLEYLNKNLHFSFQNSEKTFDFLILSV